KLWQPFKGTLGKTARGEVVLLEVPGAILGDDQAIQALVQLKRALRGRRVRLVSSDPNTDPASSLIAIKHDWADEESTRKIDLDFVSRRRITADLSGDPSNLWNTVKLTSDWPEPAQAPASPSPPSPAPVIRATKIFIASSSELRADRDEFD